MAMNRELLAVAMDALGTAGKLIHQQTNLSSPVAAAAGGLQEPKRPNPAFFLFMNGSREKIKADHPDRLTAAPSSHTEVGKIAGEMWKEMDEAAKEPYTSKATEDKARYEREKKAAAGASAVTAAGEDSDSEDLPIG